MKTRAFSDPSFEERFQKQYRDTTADYVRWAAILGALIMLGFAWQDPIISDNGCIAIQIRILGALPTSILVLLAARSLRCRPYIIWINGFFWITYTFYVVAIFNVYGPGPFGLASSVGLGSLFLIMFGIFAFSNLNFFPSLLVGSICLMIYGTAVISWTPIGTYEFITGDFLTALVLVAGGSVKSLLEERARRQQFETSELLKDSYILVEHQVQERTSELQQKNKELASEIAERMETEDKLRASEYRFRTFFEKNADAILIINPATYQIEDANSAVLAMLQCQAEDILGKELADLSPELQPDGTESRGLMLDVFNSTKKQGYNRFECIKQSPYRKSFPVEIVQTWIDDSKNPFILSTWRDISKRKEMEQQLFHAQKLESVGRLAGGVAHDFNNKLSVIIGYSELARNEVVKDSDAYCYLGEVLRAADYSRDITSKLLAFSRQQFVLPRIIDPNLVISESVNSLSHLLNKSIKIRFIPRQEVWMIRIDPVQIDQIIINLAINASDAMPDGGTLTVETSHIEIKEEDNAALLHRSGQYLSITVNDDGEGMDSETLKHIFEPFYTTKEVGKGTGLGLSIIHGIVSQNGGFIDVESSPSVGTTFRICLPRHIQADEISDSEIKKAISGFGLIMLIEDDDDVRKVTKALLLHSGYKVIDCSSSEEAIKEFLLADSKPELVLTDVVMPGIPISEMIEKIRKIKNDLKVLYMSGYAEDMENLKQTLDDNSGFIQKPLKIEELTRKIVEMF